MNAKRSNMYPGAKVWNPAVGCEYDCITCVHSFQRQLKRRKHACTDCYEFRPHTHEERLSRIPSAEIIFVIGHGDPTFCPPPYMRRILAAIKKHKPTKYQKTFYLQSKRPACFEQFLGEFPENVVLLTTLETNRDDGYSRISKAPPPSVRYAQFRALDYPRKVVTVEPIMDFDLPVFSQWIIDLAPEYVWLGFNSKPKSVSVPEPTEDKVRALIHRLTAAGLPIKGKDLRGMRIPGVEMKDS